MKISSKNNSFFEENRIFTLTGRRKSTIISTILLELSAKAINCKTIVGNQTLG